MLLLYNILAPAVFLLLLPMWLLRMVQRGGWRQNFGQRFARYTPATRARLRQPCIWIQSISVGETLIALKLARALHAEHPGTLIAVSTTTSTGHALALAAASDWLEPLYNPLDLLPLVRTALDHIRPRLLVIIEGGIWPNLLVECHRRGIPTALVNARLSPRSERRFRRVRAITGPLFRRLNLIAVPEPCDIPRWLSLGAKLAQLQQTGSIKFDTATGDTPTRTEEFRALLPFEPGTPLLIAGSTHDGEERILAEILPALRERTPNLRLLIAPRHVERTPAILRELADLPVTIALRSTLPQPGTGPDILLLDTTGELRDWYPLATAVFIGKSLTAIGGQNPAEPAALGLPVLFGPHMENFAPLVAHLLKHQAAIQVPHIAALEATLIRLLNDPEERHALSTRARTSLSAHAGATTRTTALLKHYLKA